MLQTTFRDLANRSQHSKPHKTPCCDKDTFLRFFSNVPGLIGQRLFYVFDLKKDGVVDFDEFIEGLKIISRGSHMEKIDFLFQIFDIAGDKKLTYNEMEAILTNVSDAIQAAAKTDESLRQRASEMSPEAFSSLLADAFPAESKKNMDRPSFDAWVGRHPEVLQLFDFAFTGSMLTTGHFSQGSENSGEVKMDISGIGPGQHGLVRAPIKSARPQLAGFGSGGSPSPYTKPAPNPAPGADRFVSLPLLLGTRSPTSSSGGASATPSTQIRTRGFTVEQAVALPGGKRVHCAFCGYILVIRHCFKCGLEIDCSSDKPFIPISCTACGDLFPNMQRCVSCGSSTEARADLRSQEKPNEGKTMRKVEPKEGYLVKIGKRMGLQKQLWFVLKDHFLYTYKKRGDTVPLQVLFMQGCFVEAVTHDTANTKLKFGIEMIVSETSTKKVNRLYYAESAEERNAWITFLQEHANVHNVDDYYTVGRELGFGKFSVVREAISKSTGEAFAIKVIDKALLDEKEREALRTEVAVLKLVSHPNLVRLQTVFETRRQIHIVMSFVSGGDLFDRIDQKKSFDEFTARTIMLQLCSAVKYLHARGIVHRDLKPENIMMVSRETNDIMVGDFGLSNFTSSQEKMNIACGTVAYLAPEVLSMKGYGKEVDLWSVGVIMYLVLRGRLPFDDEDEDAIIEKAKKGYIPFEHMIWNSVSEEAKDLVRRLLKVDPLERIDIDQTLAHPWFRLPLSQPPKDMSPTPPQSPQQTTARPRTSVRFDSRPPAARQSDLKPLNLSDDNPEWDAAVLSSSSLPVLFPSLPKRLSAAPPPKRESIPTINTLLKRDSVSPRTASPRSIKTSPPISPRIDPPKPSIEEPESRDSE